MMVTKQFNKIVFTKSFSKIVSRNLLIKMLLCYLIADLNFGIHSSHTNRS